MNEVRELWLELHRHHRTVVGTLSLVEDDEASWQRRRVLYLERLSPQTGFLGLAIEQNAVARICAGLHRGRPR